MSTLFGQQPTYDELVKMVTDLHDKVKAPLTLDDLPLRDLRAKLIDNGDPLDPAVTLLPGSITASLTAPGTFPELAATGTARKMNYGLAVVGAGASVAVSHGLVDSTGAGITPQLIVGSWNFWPPAGGPGAPPLFGDQGAITFSINNPTAVGADVWWLAIG